MEENPRYVSLGFSYIHDLSISFSEINHYYTMV